MLSTLAKLLKSLLRLLFFYRPRGLCDAILRWFSTINRYSRGKAESFFCLLGRNASQNESQEPKSTTCGSSYVGATIPPVPTHEIQEEVRSKSSLNIEPLVFDTQHNIKASTPEPISPSFVAPRHEVRPITASRLISPRRPRAQKHVSVDTEVLYRYTHPDMTPEKAAQGYIPPYTTNFSPELIISGWECMMHPRGSIYYYNKELNIVSNADILDANLFQAMQEIIQYIFREVKKAQSTIPSDAQLVLDTLRHPNGFIFGYYFASLQKRTLFWMSKKYVWRLFSGNDGVQSYSHIGILLGWHFLARLHYQHFPHVQCLTPKLVRELQGYLLFSIADQTFNPKTTTTYSPGELDKCLTIISNIPSQDPVSFENNESLDSCHEDGYFKWAVGYMMHINGLGLALHRFDHYHGQSNVRWRRDHLLFQNSEQNRCIPLITLISPLLFYAPNTYYRSLRDILVEKTVFFEAWILFIKELNREWDSFIIIATVLLATNMAFLAIPSLDNGENSEIRSPAQICSYLSIILSTSSIVLGQVFSRYHRIKGWENLDERLEGNLDFLLDIGCERLAIMYSLPYAYLSWSLIIFLVAFLIMCFQETQNIVRFSVGIPSAMIAIITIWCICRLRASDFVVTRLVRVVWDIIRGHRDDETNV